MEYIKYIDCDGVILDTEFGLFDEYNRLKNMGVDIKRLTYLQQLDWREWIRQAKIINDAITIIKEHNPDNIHILTKVHSLTEGLAKIEYFRELGVKNNIILVPYNLSKSSVVQAEGNLLVDDSIKNLDEWCAHNGISLFFNAASENKSIFKEQIITNDQYPLIFTLESIFSSEIEDYCKQFVLKK
jgi:hypothetical protein